MSDHIVHIVDLASTGQDAVRVADAVRTWLVDEGVMGPAPGPDGPHPGGPRRHTAVADGGAHEPPTYNGIEIRVGREFYGSGEAWESPVCPGCGYSVPVRSAAQADAVMALVAKLAGMWQERGEPRLTCSACTESRPLGDWNRLSSAVGEVGVSIVNWSRLDPAFVAAVRERLGARTVVLEEHL